MRIDIDNNVFSGTIVINNTDPLFQEFVLQVEHRVNAVKELIEKSKENDKLINSPKKKGFFNSFMGPTWSKEEVRAQFMADNSAKLDEFLKVEKGYDLFLILKVLETLGLNVNEFNYLGESLDSTRLTFLYYCSQRSQKFHDHNEDSEEGFELPLLSDPIFNLSMINQYLSDIKLDITKEGQTFVKNEIEEFVRNPANAQRLESTWHMLEYVLNKVGEQSKSYGTLSQNYIQELFYKAEMDRTITSCLSTRSLGDLVFKHRIHEFFNLEDTEHLITVNDVSLPMWVTFYVWDYRQKGDIYDEDMIRAKCGEFVNKIATWQNNEFNPYENMDVETAPSHSKCIFGIQSLVNLDEITKSVDEATGMNQPEEV